MQVTEEELTSFKPDGICWRVSRDCSRVCAKDEGHEGLCWVDDERSWAKSSEEILRSFASDMAEHDCSYGDGCPIFGSRHGRCVGCLAREALEEALAWDQEKNYKSQMTENFTTLYGEPKR